MPKSKIKFDTVRKIGLALPGVEESTAYGSPALKVRGKMLACVPTHRSAQPGSLAVRVGFDDRAKQRPSRMRRFGTGFCHAALVRAADFQR